MRRFLTISVAAACGALPGMPLCAGEVLAQTREEMVVLALSAALADARQQPDLIATGPLFARPDLASRIAAGAFSRSIDAAELRRRLPDGWRQPDQWGGAECERLERGQTSARKCWIRDHGVAVDLDSIVFGPGGATSAYVTSKVTTLTADGPEIVARLLVVRVEVASDRWRVLEVQELMRGQVRFDLVPRGTETGERTVKGARGVREQPGDLVRG